MRVISGALRGKKLREPTGMDVRPTTDMVKESIFNIIQFDIEGRRALDLFSGTGQIGIEALSRGAASVVFVDAAKDSIALTRENIKLAGVEDAATVVQSDAMSYLARGERFDLIFLDPPYDSPFLERSLEKIIEFDILKEHGIIICETRADRKTPEVSAPLVPMREYRYGKVKLALFGRSEE
ncbi:MAG: 16S rRNA (guanine(966)-N(2))-methyltransferase RsmD [Oscillospiraceae bacterium]|jgi:16S rRNA (guanine(966)-N(2))-methyltransferase RsmD|nr:16S rRNA (guanine(966)-N(2))-methyltransferase RsmD [Oscillospiraceae bacterium]